MARKLKKKKSGKRETHMVGTGIWRHLYQVWLLCWSGIRLIVSAVFLHAGKTYFCLSQHPLAVRPDELQ